MRRKISLWSVLCLVLVGIMQMTVCAAGEVTIQRCSITGDNEVTVAASAPSAVASDYGNYYLFE